VPFKFAQKVGKIIQCCCQGSDKVQNELPVPWENICKELNAKDQKPLSMMA